MFRDLVGGLEGLAVVVVYFFAEDPVAGVGGGDGVAVAAARDRLDDIGLLEVPAQRGHIVHGVHHGVERDGFAVLADEAGIGEELGLLAEVDLDIDLGAEQQPFFYQFAIDFVLGLNGAAGGQGDD